ncbi:MAG: hypothetical protein HY919_08080, partial [Elusimicrobia bacterium]|nr:hypothetical protein [Elusimicrobiota bacterium]
MAYLVYMIKIVTSIVLIVLIFTFSVFASEIEEGKKYYEEEKYELALDKFNEALNKYPNNKEIKDYIDRTISKLLTKKAVAHPNRYSIALNFYKAKEYTLAVNQLIELLEENPRHKDGIALIIAINKELARIEFEKKEKEREVVMQSVKKEKEDELLNSGLSDYNRKNYQSAIDAFTKVLEMNPQNDAAKKFLSKSYDLLIEIEQSKQTKEEKEKIVQAIRIEKEKRMKLTAKKEIQFTKEEASKIAKRFYEKGISYYEKGEYEKALPELENALIWEPGNTEIENKINEATLKLDILVRGQFVQERMEKAYSMYRKNDMLSSLSEWLVILDFEPRNPKAKEYVRKITDTLDEKQKEQSQKKLSERRQELVTQLLKQGNNYLYQKKYKEAIGEWEKILKIDSGNQTAKQNIETTKNNIKFIAQKLFEEGLNFFNTYEYALAIEKFNSALSIDPQHEKAIEFLVRAKMKADIIANKKINTKEVENLYYQAADYYMNGQ